MEKTIKQYMSKTRANYGSGVARPKIKDKCHFELKGQFLKELRENTLSGSNHEDANKHIEKVLEIVDLFQVPNITQDQLMLRVFPISLTGSILDSRGAIPTKNAVDAKVAIKEMVAYSQKCHNETSKTRRCEQCKGPHYTKDCPLKKEGTTIEEAHYTQSMEDTLSKFMSESTKGHKENSNFIKEIRASTNAAIRNQEASIKILEIQIGQMSKRVYMLSLRERMELDLEARLMGEILVINRSLDHLNRDYIELNDLNKPFKLKRNQGDDLMRTIEEGEVIKEFKTRDDELDTRIDDYPSYCDYDKKIHIDIEKEPVKILAPLPGRLAIDYYGGIMPVIFNGRGGPIAPIAIWEMNFGLKNDMIQQVKNACQFHGLPGDDANKHLDKFLHVTQSIKVNGVPDDALCLYLFPHSLTHHATAWFDHFPRNSINTFEQMAKMFLGGTFMKRRREECYDLIENMTAYHNDWDTSAHRCESCSSITSSSDTEITALKAEMREINKYLMRVLQVNQQVKAVTPNCETCGGPHSFSDCPATVGNTQKYMLQEPIKFMKMNTASSLGLGTLPGNTITNPEEDLKGITTRSRTAYQGPMIPTTSSLLLVVERETDATKDTVHPTNNGSIKDIQPLVVLTESPILNSEPVISPIIEPAASPKNWGTPASFLFYAIFPEWLNVGVAKDVFIKVGTFHFLADFVVIDFDADPRVPLILGRSFLKTGRDLIDVFKGELTLCFGKEAITFNLDQTSRYSANYNDMTANRLDVIDMACEEYSQEVLSFSDVITTLEDDPTSPEVDQSYVDTEGDILLLEAFLNDDPSLPPPNQGNYLPQVRKELKICEAKSDKSSIDEPPKVELKDLPPYLEYAFLESDDKFSVIIAKDLSVEEKTALIMVLKSHKRAIARKLFDIK
nr:reverse transcriptase domain-containing protein [Tanacetum cinerariifolium]